jgi:hypothetical protein
MTCAAGCVTRTDTPPTTEEEVVKKSAVTDHHVLRDIRVLDIEVHFDLLRSGSKDIYYSAFKAIDPLRLVLDLPNTVEENVVSPLAVENEIISKIETTTLVHQSQPLTRIEIGLNRDTAYLIDQAQAEIWVQFYADPQLSEAAAARGEPVVHPEVEAHLPEIKEPQATGAPQSASEEVLAGTRPAAEERVDDSQAVTREPMVAAPPALEEALTATRPTAEERVVASQAVTREPMVTAPPASEEVLAAARPTAEERVDASQAVTKEPMVAAPPTSEEALAASRPAAEQLLSPASRILGIEPITSGEGLAITIVGNGKLENYHAFVLRNPPRLVLDLVGVKSSQVKNTLSLVGPRVKNIRVGLHANKVRVVFDLNFIPKSEIPYHIVGVKDRLVVTFE